ncbi:hypothetical protein Tco_1009095 [Tanacetum coccineum]
MLTAIAGRHWVIWSGLRLAIMKCAKSSEIRQAFANVVSARLAKGNNKLVKALQDLKDLKYPIVDQLERLKDSPIELLMASLHLESDTEEDAPQWIRHLRSSSSQLKIPVYPEVCDPEDPWAAKEEVLLEDAIAENIQRMEKKKKCRGYQDSAMNSDYSSIDQEFKHSMGRGWYCLDFFYSRPSNDIIVL